MAVACSKPLRWMVVTLPLASVTVARFPAASYANWYLSAPVEWRQCLEVLASRGEDIDLAAILWCDQGVPVESYRAPNCQALR